MTQPVFDAPTRILDDISGDYTLDTAHTRLGFSARHAMVATVRGQFKEFTGTAHIDTSNPSKSSVQLSIVASSIDTGNAQRDGHLLSGDFFETENNPDITFVSTHVSGGGDDWSITGDLSIKGVSKPVTVDFEYTGSAQDPYGNVRLGFEGTSVLNRKDWNLNWNAALETGGVLVSDKVKLEFDISAIKVAPTEQTPQETDVEGEPTDGS